MGKGESVARSWPIIFRKLGRIPMYAFMSGSMAMAVMGLTPAPN